MAFLALGMIIPAITCAFLPGASEPSARLPGASLISSSWGCFEEISQMRRSTSLAATQWADLLPRLASAQRDQLRWTGLVNTKRSVAVVKAASWILCVTLTRNKTPRVWRRCLSWLRAVSVRLVVRPWKLAALQARGHRGHKVFYGLDPSAHTGFRP